LHLCSDARDRCNFHFGLRGWGTAIVSLLLTVVLRLKNKKHRKTKQKIALTTDYTELPAYLEQSFENGLFTDLSKHRKTAVEEVHQRLKHGVWLLLDDVTLSRLRHWDLPCAGDLCQQTADLPDAVLYLTVQAEHKHRQKSAVKAAFSTFPIFPLQRILSKGDFALPLFPYEQNRTCMSVRHISLDYVRRVERRVCFRP